MTSQGKRSYPFNRDLMWKWITEALRFREVILLGKCPIKPLLGEHFFLLLALLVRLHEASTIFDCLKLLTSLLCVHPSNCAIPALNPNSCVWQLISCISEPAWLQVHAHGIQCFLLPPTPGICMHGIVFYAFEFSTKKCTILHATSCRCEAFVLGLLQSLSKREASRPCWQGGLTARPYSSARRLSLNLIEVSEKAQEKTPRTIKQPNRKCLEWRGLLQYTHVIQWQKWFTIEWECQSQNCWWHEGWKETAVRIHHIH